MPSTDSSSQAASTSGVRTSASWSGMRRRASRSTSLADGGIGGGGGGRSPKRGATQHEAVVAALDQERHVRMPLADALGLDRPGAEALAVEVLLERLADQQRREVELRRLLMRVDDFHGRGILRGDVVDVADVRHVVVVAAGLALEPGVEDLLE